MNFKVKVIIVISVLVVLFLAQFPTVIAQVDGIYLQNTTNTQTTTIQDSKRLQSVKESLKTNGEINNNLLEKVEEATKKKVEDNAPSPKWPLGIQSMFSEYWVEFLALIVSIVGIILAISGYSFANKKKRKYLKKYLHDIDDVFTSYKMKSRRCEAELFRLQDQIEDRLTAGSIDENTYHLLEGRIQKYMEEIKSIERGENNP